MPVRNNLWTVGDAPRALTETTLTNEDTLEQMIVGEPGILSPQWLLIGRQVHTGHNGYIDLLAMAPDGGLVVIELKRNRTPREVVAQALDYASWVDSLPNDQVAGIYEDFSDGGSLTQAFRHHFGEDLDEVDVNSNHQIVVVAASLDASTERIVDYLNARDIPINVVFFQVFQHGQDQLLSRTWLLDPIETQLNASSSGHAERKVWNGEFYVSFGDSASRNWEEARHYGFICGGGGNWYSNTLGSLSEGDRVWVNVPHTGYVGVGRVTGTRQAAKDFALDGEPALDVLSKANYHREDRDDPDQCEYFVPVKWLDTVPLEQAFNEVGLFGNQNTVARPTADKWHNTVERLKREFPDFDSDVTGRA